jgi:predicted acylesterase/phospholipase RssA/CRP-like cAMP-binding protein
VTPLADDWVRALRSTPIFGTVSDVTLHQIGAAFEERRLAPGDVLVRQGDDADSLCVVLDGKLQVLLDAMPLSELGPGSIVGEVALIVGGKRSATVRAVDPTRVLALSRDRFSWLHAEYPDLVAALSSEMQRRLRRVTIARHLHDLFGPIDAETLEQIEREAVWKQLASGQVLFSEGDAADGAYIVALGRLRVSVASAGGERVIDEVGPGAWLGEMALLTRRARSATVYAVRDTELVWWSQAAFDRLVVRQPNALLETSRRLVDRLQRQMSGAPQPAPEMRTVAIIPASSTVDIGDFGAQLAAQLAHYGSTVHLTAELVDTRLGKPGISRVASDDPAQLRIAPWLIEQEATHRFVVYQADRVWSPWSDRAIRQADHILIVADGRESPVPGDGEVTLASRFAGGRAPRQSLVMLHPTTRSGFAGTARWLAARSIDRHFHVRRNHRRDLARLVRFLTGNAICLVFGGGGSRGYAHIGVVRAFEELGIPIDAVGGTSIGAVIAASAALELDSKAMLEVCAPILAGFLDPTLPVVSLMSGRRAYDGVASVAGTLDIEDLPIPLFVISTNLTRGGQVVHRRGSVVLATRASGSVPGIFPPVPWHGDLLVDGGLSNNIPVDVMAQLCTGPIVCVDVIPDVDLQSSGDVPNYLSGWNYAWRKVNPFAKQIGMPNILSILMRSATTAGRSVLRGEERLTSLYLRPPVNKWNILDFKAAAPIAEQGYRGTLEPIRRWWQVERDARMGTDVAARR